MSVTDHPAPAAPVAPPPKSSGCLKWGLIGCGAALVLLVGFAAVIVVVVFGAMKRSDVYREALSRVQNDPAVTAALGTPIEAGLYVTGKINIDGTGGHATIDFPISGPKGKATVHAVATKSGAGWDYSELTVTPANGPVINLQTAQTPPATSSEQATSTEATTTETTGTGSSTST
jgi:hypothetical protein